MLLIPCPYCGMERPEIEFRYGGQAHTARPRDPSLLNDAAWAAYLYDRTNPSGLHAERWRHTHGCGRFFNLIRNTVTDRILTSYRMGEPMPAPDTLAGKRSL
jgi:sarcosine oxidase, subunit delta